MVPFLPPQPLMILSFNISAFASNSSSVRAELQNMASNILEVSSSTPVRLESVIGAPKGPALSANTNLPS